MGARNCLRNFFIPDFSPQKVRDELRLLQQPLGGLHVEVEVLIPDKQQLRYLCLMTTHHRPPPATIFYLVKVPKTLEDTWRDSA